MGRTLRPCYRRTLAMPRSGGWGQLPEAGAVGTPELRAGRPRFACGAPPPASSTTARSLDGHQTPPTERLPARSSPPTSTTTRPSTTPAASPTAPLPAQPADTRGRHQLQPAIIGPLAEEGEGGPPTSHPPRRATLATATDDTRTSGGDPQPPL